MVSIITCTTVPLLKESALILLQTAPKFLDVQAMTKNLLEVKNLISTDTLINRTHLDSWCSGSARAACVAPCRREIHCHRSHSLPNRARLHRRCGETEECLSRFPHPLDNNTARVRGGMRILLRAFYEITRIDGFLINITRNTHGSGHLLHEMSRQRRLPGYGALLWTT